MRTACSVTARTRSLQTALASPYQMKTTQTSRLGVVIQGSAKTCGKRLHDSQHEIAEITAEINKLADGQAKSKSVVDMLQDRICNISSNGHRNLDDYGQLLHLKHKIEVLFNEKERLQDAVVSIHQSVDRSAESCLNHVPRREDSTSGLRKHQIAATSMTRKAVGEAIRFSDLSLDEKELIKHGKHVLITYTMRPKAGIDYLAAAACFASTSPVASKDKVRIADHAASVLDALVYDIDPDGEEMKIAYPTMLFDKNTADGRAMMDSTLTGEIHKRAGVGYIRICEIYFPPQFVSDGASSSSGWINFDSIDNAFPPMDVEVRPSHVCGCLSGLGLLLK